MGLSLNRLILLVLLLLACSIGYGETFSFAIITDPHLDGNADRKAKFEAAIDWVIEKKDNHVPAVRRPTESVAEGNDIELVFVLGDIAWGGSKRNRNLTIAKTILDRLNKADILYIPMIGNNEIQHNCEEEFQDVFGRQYIYLSKMLKHWQKASIPVNGIYLRIFPSIIRGVILCARILIHE